MTEDDWLGVGGGGKRRRGRRSLERRIERDRRVERRRGREPEDEAAEVELDDPAVDPKAREGVLVVLYVPFDCPFCLEQGRAGRPVETRGRTKDGRRRYHYCPRCELEYDSLERQTRVIGRRR